MAKPLTIPEILSRAKLTPTGLAMRIGIFRQRLDHWTKTGRIPAEFAIAIEEATGIPRNRIRPDLYPLGGPDLYLARRRRKRLSPREFENGGGK